MKCPALLLTLASSVAAETSFVPWSYTERNLFPSALISTATVDWNGEAQMAEDKKTANDPQLRKRELPIYGDENGWLAVEFTGLRRGATVEVEISLDGFMKPSTWKGKVTHVTKAGEARIFPKASWNYAALLKVRQQRPANAVFRVKVDNLELDEATETCVIRSINDCPFFVKWDDDESDVDDFSWLFAAYVNENHPEVDVFLKEAIQSGLVSSFDGYQSKDPKKVLMQIFAIWNALQRRGIKYCDISTTIPNRFVISQSVRFIDESLASTQANCVDGSVLMASILRKIGIQAYLVMIPGHCFLAFDSGADEDDQVMGLETTMLGHDQLHSSEEIPQLSKKLQQEEFKTSYSTFSQALRIGRELLEKHAEAIEGEEDPQTQMISITEAREFGITPIASEKR